MRVILINELSIEKAKDAVIILDEIDLIIDKFFVIPKDENNSYLNS